jgi:hypothetical protein
MFRYYNIDHAIQSGINTAEKIIQKNKRNGEYRSQDEETANNLPDPCEAICRQ